MKITKTCNKSLISLLNKLPTIKDTTTRTNKNKELQDNKVQKQKAYPGRINYFQIVHCS